MKANRGFLTKLCAFSLAGGFACGDEEPQGPTRSISIAVSPATLTLQQLESDTVTITLTRSNYEGDVMLHVAQAPHDMTTTLVPQILSRGTTRAGLILDAGLGMQPWSLTIQATGDGVSMATAELEIAERPMYVLMVEQGYSWYYGWLDPVITQGDSTTITVKIHRESFSGGVTLAATGLPEGVTARFDPAVATAHEATLTLTAAADVPAGSSSLTITGTAEGLEDRSTSVTLHVAERAPTWTFCPEIGSPRWVAYQDGDGEWRRAIPGATEDSWLVDIRGDRGGVAYVTEAAGAATVSIWYGLLDELRSHGSSLCTYPTGEPFDIAGSVAGVDATDQVFVSLGASTAVVNPAISADFTLENVVPGYYDLIATRMIRDESGDVPVVRATEVFLRKDVWLTPGRQLPLIDFTTYEAFQVVEHQAALQGSDGDSTVVTVAYFRGPHVNTGVIGPPVSGVTASFAGIPADRQASSDLHLLTVVAMDDPGHPTSVRTVQEQFRLAGDRAVWLDAPLFDATVSSVPEASYPRLQIVHKRQPQYRRAFFATFSQPGIEWRLAASGSFTGWGDVILAIPDFSGVEGWDPVAWALRAGVEAAWSFTGTDWRSDGAEVFTAPHFDGGRVLSAARRGTITP